MIESSICRLWVARCVVCVLQRPVRLDSWLKPERHGETPRLLRRPHAATTTRRPAVRKTRCRFAAAQTIQVSWIAPMSSYHDGKRSRIRSQFLHELRFHPAVEARLRPRFQACASEKDDPEPIRPTGFQHYLEYLSDATVVNRVHIPPDDLSFLVACDRLPYFTKYSSLGNEVENPLERLSIVFRQKELLARNLRQALEVRVDIRSVGSTIPVCFWRKGLKLAFAAIASARLPNGFAIEPNRAAVRLLLHPQRSSGTDGVPRGTQRSRPLHTVNRHDTESQTAQKLPAHFVR